MFRFVQLNIELEPCENLSFILGSQWAICQTQAMKQLLLFIAVLAFVGCASTPLFDLNDNSHVILEAAIRKEISKPTGELTKADLEKVTSLDIRDRPIRDVGPLVKLTRLKKLSISNNKITDISSLTKLTQLEELDLHGNRGIDISPLVKFSQLKKLDLRYNDKLTKAEVDKLQKALPKCEIDHHFKK
jgi:hypothetical protein